MGVLSALFFAFSSIFYARHHEWVTKETAVGKRGDGREEVRILKIIIYEDNCLNFLDQQQQAQDISCSEGPPAHRLHFLRAGLVAPPSTESFCTRTSAAFIGAERCRFPEHL